MKKAALVLVLSILSMPAMAQTGSVAEVAPPVSAASDGTVRQGPLFLGGFVDKIKKSFSRQPADPVLSAPTQAAKASVASQNTSTDQVLMAKAQREAYAAAALNRNRQIAAAISASADRDIAIRTQEIAQQKAMQAARAAGVALPAAPAGQGGTAAPSAPVRIIDGTQKPAQGNKPIFNNFR